LSAGGQPATGYLAEKLGALGYRTHAVITHSYLMRRKDIRDSFATVDESLVSRAARPTESTAEEVTDRVLQAIDGIVDRGFVWAHYYDPHAPYVEELGSHVIGSVRSAYAAEIRRTDAAIGRLVDSLEGTGNALVLITADHGEEFGEHRSTRHGYTLYEEAVRVPMIAWSPGPDPRRYLPGPVPAGLDEAAPFLLATATGTSFFPDEERFLYTEAGDDLQYAVLKRGWKLIHHLTLGYSELYDLSADPLERVDLAQREPARVRELGEAIGRGYRRHVVGP
jgi:hypothetical protein